MATPATLMVWPRWRPEITLGSLQIQLVLLKLLHDQTDMSQMFLKLLYDQTDNESAQKGCSTEFMERRGCIVESERHHKELKQSLL